MVMLEVKNISYVGIMYCFEMKLGPHLYVAILVQV